MEPTKGCMDQKDVDDLNMMVLEAAVEELATALKDSLKVIETIKTEYLDDAIMELPEFWEWFDTNVAPLQWIADHYRIEDDNSAAAQDGGGDSEGGE